MNSMSDSDRPSGMTIPPESPSESESDDEDEEVTGAVDRNRVELERSNAELAKARSGISSKMRAIREKLERSRGYVWVDREHLARRSRPDFG